MPSLFLSWPQQLATFTSQRPDSHSPASRPQVPFEVHAVVGPNNASRVVDDIVDISKKLDACMVVVGTHGRHPLQELFLGSVATGLLSKSPVPVAVVR